MSYILVVEDDADIAHLVRLYLERAEHEVRVLGSGQHVQQTAHSRVPDAIVLDRMLPGIDGLEICRSLREDPVTSHVPVLMLTARAEEADRITGLDVGADDYVTKPFSPKELVARVHALMRRSTRAPAPSAAARILEYRTLRIDEGRHLVSDAGHDVKLTAKEFLLLRYLIEHRGRVLSRDLLLSDVWGYRYTGGTRTVDVHIRRLREKLPMLVDAVETIKQFGYKLADP